MEYERRMRLRKDVRRGREREERRGGERREIAEREDRGETGSERGWREERGIEACGSRFFLIRVWVCPRILDPCPIRSGIKYHDPRTT